MSWLLWMSAPPTVQGGAAAGEGAGAVRGAGHRGAGAGAGGPRHRGGAQLQERARVSAGGRSRGRGSVTHRAAAVSAHGDQRPPVLGLRLPSVRPGTAAAQLRSCRYVDIIDIAKTSILQLTMARLVYMFTITGSWCASRGWQVCAEGSRHKEECHLLARAKAATASIRWAHLTRDT